MTQTLAMIGRPLPGGSVATVQNARDHFRLATDDGVVSKRLDELEHTHTSGLDIAVASGHGRVSGITLELATGGTITASAGDATHDRIDRSVLRLDPSGNGGQGSVEVVIKEGTPATPAVAPALTQSLTGIYEVALYQWTVAATSATITGLTDERNVFGPIADSVAFSGAVIRKDANQSIANATSTEISWQTSVIDEGSWVDLANNRFVVPAGVAYVSIGMNAEWVANATGYRLIVVHINGAVFVGGLESRPRPVDAGASFTHGGVWTAPVAVSVGDLVTALGYQTSGGALNLANQTFTWLAIRKVG